jgi:hypothetical protein
MDRDLMKTEPLDNLGLGQNSEYVRVQNNNNTTEASSTKEGKGFVAGTGVAPGKFKGKGGAGWGIGWIGTWGEKEKDNLKK